MEGLAVGYLNVALCRESDPFCIQENRQTLLGSRRAGLGYDFRPPEEEFTNGPAAGQGGMSPKVPKRKLCV